ncbi:TonB-linked outer membrane protein, SusC/RagA family [Mucilaginibacter pineti]|uniref:TonB-linked outer membrane protein, SusC/RagA family n=1 Tax=Mucilaginibacter pineti TaxID=1391627 RepID=A0A1G7L8H8_9SPHI|nr:SusC/RagA family TonB-linked outer membrane protein [Mucilaginibacter pineti]SDF45686.1 TonB-linked outer membrane protein, SusC/RagA family [Mucilaginibacter pineti]
MLKNLRSKLKYSSFVLTVASTCFLNCALATEIARSQDLDKRISIDVEKKTLKETLDQISKQAHVNIIYSNAKGILKNPVTIHAKDQQVSKVLTDLLSPLTLTYEVIGDQIVVKFDKTSSRSPSQEQTEKHRLPVKGRVTNTNGSPLPGATIKIKNGPALATTDSNGEFEIHNVADSTVLQVSFIGYLTKEIVITNTNYLTITLENGSNQLNEVSVVSTGYQTIPKERATGSFAQPIKAMFNDRVSTDIFSKLNGITSGLVFNSNTTAAQNGQLDINIRGRSTIFANDQPLIVIDNFPYNGDINNINPNDVEDVTVLKDAAAASIWGVRAGNGVIVIRTKKGKLAQPLRIGFNASITAFDKPNLAYNPNQLNSSSYVDLETYLFKQGYYDANLNDVTNYPVISPAVELLTAQRNGTISASSLNTQLSALKNLNVNDQIGKYLLHNANNQQYGLNFSGGSSKATYFFSSGYDYNLPSAKDNSYQRITLNSQNTFKPIANLEISVGLNVVKGRNQTDNTLSNTLNHVFPYSQIADAGGQPRPISYGYRDSYVQAAPSNGFLDWSYSPLKDLGAANNITTITDTRLTSGIKYTFIEGLSGEIKYQYERTNIQNRDFESQDTYYTRNLINQFAIQSNGQVTGYNIPLGGISGLGNTNIISNNLRGQLNYNRSWKNSTIAALVGYEFSQVSSASNGSSLYGYNDDNATFVNVNTTTFYNINPSGNTTTINNGINIGGTLDRIRSSFANLAYSYKDKYTLSGSARIDGSNYFGVATNQKSLPLWSAGGKWDINKENFYNISWLPTLDFRATYGFNGNLDRSVTGVTTLLYQSNALYTNLPYATILNIGNPDLSWEKTAITNLGIDFSSKKNIISGSLEFYFKKETDVLGYKTFPNNAGILSLEGNYSDMSGHGFDVTLTSQNLSGRLKWSTTVLVSHATDKVTRYDLAPLASQLVGADGNGTVAVPNLGKPVFGLYSYKYVGLNPSTGNPIGYVNGVKSEDYDAIINNSSVSDLVYFGPARPTYFGGLNNHFSYKGFDLNVQINYKLGYYFRKPTTNYSQIISNGSAYLIVNQDYNKRWMKSGDEKTTNIPSLIYPFSSTRDQFYQGSDINVEKGDHIRLQDISLSYNFNRSVYPKLPFSNLQLFMYANNIGILWKANQSGLDPDAVPGGNDRTTTPNPRSIAFGIKGNF